MTLNKNKRKYIEYNIKIFKDECILKHVVNYNL